MARLDDFESVFRSAVKDRFEFAPPAISKALFVCDESEETAAYLLEKVDHFLDAAHSGDIEWNTLPGPDFDSVGEILARVEQVQPDLVACFRHVVGRGMGLHYSLGSAVDTLTQQIDVPILLLPDRTTENFDARFDGTWRVLVVTDHLTGDDRLVNWGATMCSDGGTLYLAHIEDQATFERYADVMSKLPRIDTDVASEQIRTKLMQLPADYIATVGDALREGGFNETIEPIVTMGEPVAEYRKIIDTHDIHLVVMNTKDADQMAMAAMAHALAIEIRDRPLLLL